MDKKYTVEEVAEKIKVSKRTVLREIKRGKLNVQKAGRRYLISAKDLSYYLGKDKANLLAEMESYLQSKRGEMVELLQRMVQMSSDTNNLGQEGRLANFIKTKLEEFGIRSVLYSEDGAIAVRGSFGFADEGILLDCPLDTTTPGDENKWKYPPFEGVIKQGRMFGRGTADCKAGMVAMIYTLRALKKYIDEEKVRVELVFDGGEQNGEYLGMELALKKGLPVKAGIVGYAGDNHELMIGARGYHRYSITSIGHSAHTGGRENKGINAIDKLSSLICAMNIKKLPDSKNKYFDFGQRFTFAMIEGGRAINIVPDTCKVKLDVRTTPSFTKERVDNFLEKSISEIHKKDKQAEFSFNYDRGEEGYILDEGEKIISILEKEIKSVYPKRNLKLVATGPAHIGNLLHKYNIPVCLWGPKGGNVHSYDEYVEIDSLPKTALVYVNSILNYFGVN